VQHITERDRIKQRIIRMEVVFHLIPKMPPVRKKLGEGHHTRDFVSWIVKINVGREGCIEKQDLGAVLGM
jgi:hypothetical protein